MEATAECQAAETGKKRNNVLQDFIDSIDDDNALAK